MPDRWEYKIVYVDAERWTSTGLPKDLNERFDAWGLAAVLIALACRLFLKFRLTREFDLPNPNYSLTLARDILSFAVFFGSFWSSRVNWRGRDFIVRRDGTMERAVR